MFLLLLIPLLLLLHFLLFWACPRQLTLWPNLFSFPPIATEQMIKENEHCLQLTKVFSHGIPATGLRFSGKGSREIKCNNCKDEHFWLRMETRKGPYKKERGKGEIK